MGGIGSGRKRITNLGAVEQVCRLDIRNLRRNGWLIDGLRFSTELRWTRRNSGETFASADVTADLRDPADRHLILEYVRPGERVRQRISILARPMPFGSERFFFVCPVLHITCEVLPYGVHGFATRQANRLTYGTQGDTALGRAVSARMKIEEKLWPRKGLRHGARGANRERLFGRYIELDMFVERAIDAVLGSG